MSCADCEYRSKDWCCLFDDIIINYQYWCFMDTSVKDFENEG